MIPLQLWLKGILPYQSNRVSLWHCPELAIELEKLPEHGSVFLIERTTSGFGPFVLWYPASAFQEQIERDKEIDRLLAEQDAAIERAKEKRKLVLIERIALAKRCGDWDEIQEYRKELAKL